MMIFDVEKTLYPKYCTLETAIGSWCLTGDIFAGILQVKVDVKTDQIEDVLMKPALRFNSGEQL